MYIMKTMKNCLLYIIITLQALNQQNVNTYMDMYLCNHPLTLKNISKKQTELDIFNDIIEDVARMMYKMFYSADGIYCKKNAAEYACLSVDDAHILFHGTATEKYHLLKTLFYSIPNDVIKRLSNFQDKNMMMHDMSKTFDENLEILFINIMHDAITKGRYMILKQMSNDMNEIKRYEVKSFEILPKFDKHMKKMYEMNIIGR